ncbi:MAG TPA: hypothetical protein PK854_10640 [Oscillospiraceae bacterium]|nr:hypothetical protein [Oscillospiraceae bacterium]HPS35707.1 hypothetical protein [Oscillospiraceae bacterium]
MKRILYVVLASLVLICAFVPVKKFSLSHRMDNAEFGMSRLISDGEIDRLFIGSSIFRQGLDVNIIGANTSRSVYLLSYNGNQPCLEASELRYLIERGVNIKELYVDMYAYTLATEVSLSDDRLVLDTDFKYMAELYKMLSEKGKAGIKELFEMAVTANNELFLTWPLSYPLVNSRYRNGSSTAGNVGKTAEILNSLPIYTRFFNLNFEQVTSLFEIIQLCRENNIKLVFVEAPKYLKIVKNKTYRVIMKEYMTLLAAENVQMIVTDQTFSTYLEMKDTKLSLIKTYEFDSSNATYFQDLIHLSTAGREAFSAALSELIEK